MAKILLSESTNKAPINELVNDMEYQIKKNLQGSLIFLCNVMKQLILPNCCSR